MFPWGCLPRNSHFSAQPGLTVRIKAVRTVTFSIQSRSIQSRLKTHSSSLQNFKHVTQSRPVAWTVGNHQGSPEESRFGPHRTSGTQVSPESISAYPIVPKRERNPGGQKPQTLEAIRFQQEKLEY